MMITSLLPEWPLWSIYLLSTMGALLAITCLVFNSSSDLSAAATAASSSDDDDKKKKKNVNDQKQYQAFKQFQWKYLTVYLIIMLADWMQGTHMYTLYLSYNVNVSALFLTGFLSGAIFAPFLGSAVDQFGRKRSCIVYCILEIIINTLEHSHNFQVLLFGRVLGGISTNLLFSAFESWMTTEHRRHGFPEEWLSNTFSLASVGNGTTAIIAGIVAQLFEDALGPIGPFQAVIFLTALSLLLILRWEENYGETEDKSHEKSSVTSQFIEGWKTTVSDSNVWRIGLTQALSEGAMYTFVFMWVPTLLFLDPPGGVPTGCVFSALMTAITMGGIYFQPFNAWCSSMELSASLIYGVAGLSMAVPAICLNIMTKEQCLIPVLVSFMIVEMSVGMFMPAAGSLRSKYVPDSQQGAILNIFRLPLNAVVVLGTHATDVLEANQVFMLVCGSFIGASLLQATMISSSKKSKKD